MPAAYDEHRGRLRRSASRLEPGPVPVRRKGVLAMSGETIASRPAFERVA